MFRSPRNEFGAKVATRGKQKAQVVLAGWTRGSFDLRESFDIRNTQQMKIMFEGK